MNTQNNTVAVTEREQFLLPSMNITECDFTSDELAEDMDGLQVSFPRVKIPSGGMLQFEIPSDDPENPDYEKNLTCIILCNHDNYAYWPEGSEYDDNTAPLCSSTDGKQGIGEPGGTCATCALNRFGTGPEGRGKACKNMRMLYLLRSGEYMPIQLALPPTSLSPFREFMNQSFMIRRRATFGSVVQIGLKKMNNGKDDYSVATFRRLYDLEGEELAQARAYATSFKEQIKMMLQQRASAILEQRDTGCDYEVTDTLPANSGTQFCIAPPIDGDREALPA